MAKEFYTERDIEDLYKRGVLSLDVDENFVLTELAYEKANRLGLKLIYSQADTPPSAPIRPYLSRQVLPSSAQAPVPPPLKVVEGELKTRIQSAVQARLGNQVDPNLLDIIIQRVMAGTGVK